MSDRSDEALNAPHPAPTGIRTADSAMPSLRPWTFLANIPGDAVEFGRRVWNAEYIPLYAGIAASTAVLLVTDYDTWQPFKKVYERSKPFQHGSDIAEFIGNGTFQFSLAGAFAAYGLVGGDRRALRTGSEIAEAVLASGAVVQVIKHLTGRESPFVSTEKTGKWKWFPNPLKYHRHVPAYDAFPTGHLCTALATLVVIAEQYPEQKWIPWVGYPTVAAIAVGMLGQGVHWWSDYPLGLAIGYSFGMLIAQRDHAGEPDVAQRSGGGPTLGMTILMSGTPALDLRWRL